MSKITQQQHITETARQGQLTGELVEITIITAGMGSSGYYAPETLELAAQEQAFTVGTKMYVDHAEDKSKRSIKNLAAVLATQPTYDAAEQKLKAHARVFTSWREPIMEMKDAIGVSIDAAAEVGTTTVDGQVVTAIERIIPNPLNSVDFVTDAGRGGRIAQILEHATAKEVLSETTDQYLTNALRGLYPDQNAWVSDFDPDKRLVYFHKTDPNNPDTPSRFQQPYIQNPETGGVSIIGEPTPVQREIIYVAVDPVDGQPNPTTEGDPVMEQKLAALEAEISEKNTRINELEAQVAEAREQLAEATMERTKAAASQIVERHFEGIEAPTGKARLIEAALTGEFDPEAFEKTVTEAAAEYAPTTGAVRGLGDNTHPVTESATVTDESIIETLNS